MLPHPGRGAQQNTPNPYHSLIYDAEVEGGGELRTQLIPTRATTILNEINSPDLGEGYGLNPYQGCEHGCVYCFARPTHQYWGYSAGLDFEQKVLYKPDAPELLRKALRKKSHLRRPVMISGNTDCYQPAERDLEITRRCIEVLLEHRHPFGLITKNALIVRDLDLLEQAAALNIVHAALTVTTQDETLRRLLEPRTSTTERRFRAVEALTGAGVPVTVNLAPVIPGLTDHEIIPIVERAAAVGAGRVGYGILRLNDQVADIFTDWLRRTYPDRAERVLHRIRDCHGGKLGEKRFHHRRRGNGPVASVIRQQFEVARRRFFPHGEYWPAYDFAPFETWLRDFRRGPQLNLFE